MNISLSLLLCWEYYEGLVQVEIALSAGAVEYTDCFSAENECPKYNTKQSDVEVE